MSIGHGSQKDLVVLGAGLAGLSTAYHAGKNTRVFEALDRVGGVCATDVVQGFHFDQAGHLLHRQRPQTWALVKKILPGAWQTILRDARIHLQKQEVRYPFQANLFGLSPQIKAFTLQDYLNAVLQKSPKAKNFAAWAQQNFGTTMARLFFEPYNRKLWTVAPRELTLDWMKNYVPRPEVERVIAGAFTDIAAGGGYNAKFHYPRRGGIGVLAQALAKKIPQLKLNARAVQIDARKRTVDITGYGRVAWNHLVTTLPLPQCVALLKQPSSQVLEAAQRLRCNSVFVVNLGIRCPRIHKAHWIYFPEPKYLFYRLGFPSNFGRVAPPGCSSLYAEVALPAGQGWPRRKALAKQVRQELLKLGILPSQDSIVVEHLQYIPYAYVIYNKDYHSARQQILAYLQTYGIFSIGRWGGWEYSAMEDALLAGQITAQAVQAIR